MPGHRDGQSAWVIAYRQAADAGHTDAANNLGILLAEAERYEEAEEMFRRAADTGHTEAAQNLDLLPQVQPRPRP